MICSLKINMLWNPTLNLYFNMCYLCSIWNRLYAVILGLLYPTLKGSDKRWTPFPLKSCKAWIILVFILNTKFPNFLNWQVSLYPNYILSKRKEQYIKKHKNQFVTFPSSQWTAKFSLVKKNMLDSESSLEKQLHELVKRCQAVIWEEKLLLLW